MNKIILTGNLTKDPEVRYTNSGKAMAKVPIAVNRPFKKDETDFFNLVAWQKTAEFVGKYLNKGTRVLIEGRLQNNHYTDDKGTKHYSETVVVDNVEFAGGKSSNKKSDYEWNGANVPDSDVPF